MKPGLYGAGEREEGGCQTRSSHFPICSQVIPVFLRTVPDQSFWVAASGQLLTLAFPASFPESLATDRQSERGRNAPPPLVGAGACLPSWCEPRLGSWRRPGRPVVQLAPHCSGLLTPSLPFKVPLQEVAQGGAWPPGRGELGSCYIPFMSLLFHLS